MATLEEGVSPVRIASTQFVMSTAIFVPNLCHYQDGLEAFATRRRSSLELLGFIFEVIFREPLALTTTSKLSHCPHEDPERYLLSRLKSSVTRRSPEDANG